MCRKLTINYYWNSDVVIFLLLNKYFIFELCRKLFFIINGIIGRRIAGFDQGKVVCVIDFELLGYVFGLLMFGI